MLNGKMIKCNTLYLSLLLEDVKSSIDRQNLRKFFLLFTPVSFGISMTWISLPECMKQLKLKKQKYRIALIEFQIYH